MENLNFYCEYNDDIHYNFTYEDLCCLINFIESNSRCTSQSMVINMSALYCHLLEIRKGLDCNNVHIHLNRVRLPFE